MTPPMTPHLVRQTGIALYGAQWKRPLAFAIHQELKADLSRVEKKVDQIARNRGEPLVIPPEYGEAMLKLLAKHQKARR